MVYLYVVLAKNLAVFWKRHILTNGCFAFLRVKKLNEAVVTVEDKVAASPM